MYNCPYPDDDTLDFIAGLLSHVCSDVETKPTSWSLNRSSFLLAQAMETKHPWM